MCTKMYPWFYYKNHGNGHFGRMLNGALQPDQIQYRPAPLETESADSSLTSLPIGTNAGTVDLNGDGYLDYVRAQVVSSASWLVFHNNTSGTYDPESLAIFPFATPDNALLHRVDPSSVLVSSPVSVEGLFDLNGDGLMDHWLTTGLVTTTAFNDGVQFRPSPSEAIQSYIKPGNDGVSFADPLNGGPSNFIVSGYRYDSVRTLDMDGDGRGDVASSSESTSGIVFNEGGDFALSPISIGDPEALKHYIVVSNVINDPNSVAVGGQSYSWELRSDMIDLDGDGIPEGVSFGKDRSLSTHMGISHAASNPGPRLLTQINNHRGATTTVAYASLQDPIVTQSSGTHLDGQPFFADPHPTWVVKNITTTDGYAGTSAVTGYKYYSPVMTTDDRGRVGFRGFLRVETTMPTNGTNSAEMVARVYGYTADWSGRLTAEYVHPGEHPN